MLICALGLVSAQERPGNFEIRFQPAARLQTGAEIPFPISVKDALGKPLTNATVRLQIETPEHEHVRSYRAPAVDAGVYLAKPVFPEPGQWNVYVEARRDDAVTSRSIQFNVPQSAE